MVKNQLKQPSVAATPDPACPPPALLADLSDAQLALDQADSVVQTYASVLTPPFAYPYSTPTQTTVSGTAFVVRLDVRGKNSRSGKLKEERWLMTNCHCISHAAVIKTKRRDQDRWYDARLLVDGYECDLAILTVDEDSFWFGLRAIEFQPGFPKLLDPITVLGFPTGGQNLSATQGVVSRIDVSSYSGYSGVCHHVALPIIQIDAAINPGNSGGPAICKGCAMGVAFSGLANAQNIGYVVPSQVVLRFIRDFEKNRAYTQFAYPPFTWQPLETDNMRRFCGVEKVGRGVRIREVDPQSDVSNKGLNVGDVLLAIEGTEVGYDGKVPVPEIGKSCRVSLWYLFHNLFTGERCTLTVRTPPSGHERQISFTLCPFDPPIFENPTRSEPLQYLIVAGLVFQPLSYMYMSDADGWESYHLKKAYVESWKQHLAPGEQVIVLSDVLAHPLNLGLEGGYILLERMNGAPVRNISELAVTIDTLADDETLAFEFSDNMLFAAGAGEIRTATVVVLEQNGIHSDRRVPDRGEDVASVQKRKWVSRVGRS